MNSIFIIITEFCAKGLKYVRVALQKLFVTSSLFVVVHWSTVFFFKSFIRKELFARLTRRQVQVWSLQEQGNIHDNAPPYDTQA